MDFNPSLFEQDLLAWYSKNKRDLPWRHRHDAYGIWISEMMLQQTQVNTVIPFYERFLNRFPTVFDLAKADEQEVLNLWKGLGYYSRARNLHATAKRVVDEFKGEFPQDGKTLKTLKGIGDYSQGAILSIAFNQPVPAVDGNVMRLMSRILTIEDNVALDVTKKKFEKMMKDWISKTDPSSYNQALMEMGALICLPTQPRCEQCPLVNHCSAFKAGKVSQFPVKVTLQKIKDISIISLVLTNSKNEVLIHRRPDQGLLASLWEFPQIENGTLDEMKTKLKPLVNSLSINEQKDFNFSHQFSHLKWQVEVYSGTVDGDLKIEDYRYVKWMNIDQYPMSTAHQKITHFMTKKLIK